MSHLTGKYHALLALLVLLLLLSPIALLPIELWDRWQNYDDEIARTSSSLQRFKSMIASKDAISDEISQYKTLTETRYFFPAKRAAALVSGDMQKKINNLADTHAAMVASTRVLPIVPDEQWVRHGISVNLRGSIESIRAILHGVADTQPLMNIDKLKIRGVSSPRRRGKTKNFMVKREATMTFELYAWQLR